MSPYQTVKSVINPCLVCRKFNNLSYKYPKMTDLPKHRVVLLSTSTLSIKPLLLSLTEMCRGSYPISIIMFPGLILDRRK